MCWEREGPCVLSKRPPCLDSKRHRVCRQHVRVLLVHTTTPHTPQPRPRTQPHTTQITHNTPHRSKEKRRRRKKHRKDEREDEREEGREDEREDQGDRDEKEMKFFFWKMFEKPKSARWMSSTCLTKFPYFSFERSENLLCFQLFTWFAFDFLFARINTGILSTSTVTGTSLCGKNHLQCVIALRESWNPKSTSFLTRCCACEASIQNPYKLGKTKLNCNWRHANSKNWLELTGSRWISRRQFSKDSLGILDKIQKMMAELRFEPEQCQRKEHLHFDEQWHFVENTRKWRKFCCEFFKRCNIRHKISIRMVVISGTWLWENVVRNSRQQAKWWMEQSCWKHDAQLRWKRTSCISKLNSKGGGKKTIHYSGSEEFVVVILRTVISVNQISICGEVADFCNEWDPDYAESEICESLVIPTESANANTTSQSSTSSAQGNLTQVYFKKFAELPEYHLSKLCKDAGFLEKSEKGQFFITIEEGSKIMQTACR